jgi:putative holliday junction resolvase
VQSRGRFLGVDLGDARVGLAMSDELRMLAHPFQTLNAKTGEHVPQQIADVVSRENIAEIVIGVPRNMDGSYGPAAEKSKLLAEQLRLKLQCPVHLWDERLTTVQAQKALHATGRTEKKSRAIIDQVAAQIILQAYLDSLNQE